VKDAQTNSVSYEVVRSRRSTADIIIERDGSVLVRAPEWADDDQIANIVGPICETGDTLGYGRSLARAREGDVICIATAGAYGRVMSSSYNSRSPAVEVVLEEAER